MRSADSHRSPSGLAIIALVLAAALAACTEAEPVLTDAPAPSPRQTASDGPAGTQVARTTVHIDAPVALAGLLGTIESAYEIGHPNVDLVIALADADGLSARLLGTEPIELFLVDGASADALAETGGASTDGIPFAADHVALLADRASEREPAIGFLAWLVGAEGRAIIASAGLPPTP